MSKRQEIRDRRKKEKIRNRILVIGLMVVGALLITFALILPSLKMARNANATQTAVNGDPINITPRTFNAKVDGTHLGDPNAPVKVIAYEDFRCSGCLYYTNNVEPTIIKDYVETGKVYYTYAIYLVIDGNDGTDASYRSANAALCAAEQNKFWEYHDILYANQITESADLYTDTRLSKMAQFVGLNMDSFNQCYQAKKYASDVEKDVNEGVSLKVTGTPSIFINGNYYADFSNATKGIDDALAGK